LCVVGSAWFVWIAVLQKPLQVSGRDFDCLWVAGRLVLEGRFAEIYDLDRFNAAATAMLGIPITGQAYSYPPHALFLAVPFAALPIGLAYPLWVVGGLALFLYAARPYLPERLWVAALSPASIICISYGQYGLLTSALFLLAFRKLPWAAALLTFKPHIGFLCAVPFVREPRKLLAVVALTALLTGLSLLAFGTQAWRGFFEVSIPLQASRVGSGQVSLWFNTVTPAVGYGILGQIGFGAAALLLLWRNFNVFTAATATMLLAPYGFHYDMPAVCLGFAVLISTRWAQLAPWEKVLACLGFASPGIVLAGTWLLPPVLLAGLWVQVRQSGPAETSRTDEKAIVAG
jgi:hypothetical protein